MVIPVMNEEQLPGDHTPKGGVLTILALLFTVHSIISKLGGKDLMPLTFPKFWEQPDSCLGRLLEPLSWFYQGGAALHQISSKPYQAGVPVISIGNLVLGGAGKTPVTLALAQHLQAMGRIPHIISRGYGGTLKGPLLVEPVRHLFHQVGDEPLLLAKTAPTWISKDRRAAVNPAIQSGGDILLLDDAHQNYTLAKDLSLVVVDGMQGFGNGRIFPAGPLRQSLKAGLKNITALIFINQNHDSLPESLPPLHCPIIHASIVPIDPKPCAVLAFSGIGYPKKFHQTLVAAGYEVKVFAPFPDHHPYTEEDLRKLQITARGERACLITTEKDAVRIPAAYRQDVLVLPMRLAFEPDAALKSLLEPFLPPVP